MLIRKFQQEDFNALRKILAVCFGDVSDRIDEEELERIKNAKGLRNRDYFNRYVAFDDQGNMTSTIRIVPYQAYFDKGLVRLSGIGAVASLPQYRNKGAVRACFSRYFSDEYDNGCAFSYLYGSSMAYYKKFGYALACDLNDWEAKIHRLIPCGTKGSYELVSGDVSGIKEVYAQMCKRFSMLAQRQDEDWLNYEEKDYLKDNTYTYLYRDENGTPKSFFTYKKVVSGWDNILDLGENVYFYDKEGFGAILDFAIKIGGNFHILKMSFPTDANVDTVLVEHARSAITKKCRSNGMARCINLESALKMAAFCGSGRAVIKINDDMIQQNNGTWAIEWKDDNFVSLSKTDKAPQAEMSIEIFTALLLGKYNMSDAEFISGLEIFSGEDTLRQIFYKKRMAIYDHF